ncbi:MAG: hypothetical protein OXC27_06795, partial [Caldilineaceae bacterium]|nr:hypothetical protein [Caldilineaceae bacterium]
MQALEACLHAVGSVQSGCVALPTWQIPDGLSHMLMQSEITQKLQSAFEPHQVDALLEVIGLSYNNLVKVSDFSELKAIVQDLAESQKAMGASQEAMGKSQEAM